MGEFGAVEVVSGNIAGQTDTLPLRVDKLYNEFDPWPRLPWHLLALLALATLCVKLFLEWKKPGRSLAYSGLVVVPSLWLEIGA